MIQYNLPQSLIVGGINYEIREDYRAALDILSAFNSEDLTDEQKIQTAIEILYYPAVPPEEVIEEAWKPVAANLGPRLLQGLFIFGKGRSRYQGLLWP